MNIALIIAGGVGVRMGKDIPKQFIEVNDKPIIAYTLEAFQAHPEIDAIAVVCVDGWQRDLTAIAERYGITKLAKIINGGQNGQESIRNGVFALEEEYPADSMVLVHDAIRPLVSAEIISKCIAVAEEKGNAIVSIPCAEAMLVTEDQVSSTEVFPRANLKRTQTPQGFRLHEICELHREALKKNVLDSVASCTLMVEMGRTVYFSPGSLLNIKLTTPDDIAIFEALLAVQNAK